MKAKLNDLIDYLQKKFPPNRVVAFLTPAFAAGSAWLSGYVAKHFPGLPGFTPAEIAGLMAAGAGSAVLAAYKWLDGWQKAEERRASLGLSPSEAKIR